MQSARGLVDDDEDNAPSIEEVVSRFRDLHEKRKGGALSGDALAQYEARRDDFIRAVLAAQRLPLRAGQIPRQMMRVVYSAKVVLTARQREHDTITLDLSVAGFAALVGAALPVGTSCDFKLRLGHELVGRARVVACLRQGSGGVSHRVSLAIESLPPEDRSRLDITVLDAALATFAR